MRKLNKRGKLLIIFLLCLVFICFAIFKPNKETHFLKTTKEYTLKIDCPYIKNKKVRNEIEKYIDENKTKFINLSNENKTDNQFDMTISVTSKLYNKINYIDVSNEYYIGGNHYQSEKLSYVLNKNNIIDLNFFLEENKLNEISYLTYYKIMKMNDDEHVFEDEFVKEGTKPLISNYKYFEFDDSGLTLIFPPLQVGSYSNGYVKVLLTYEEINKYLKEEFKNKSKEIETLAETPLKRDLSKYKDKKLIAFTFDDGPSKSNTNYLLDNLDKYDAKVTFFVLGNRVEDNKEVLKRGYLEGNLIGNHSYSHKNFNLLKDNEILEEIYSTNKNIKNIIGVEPNYIRPPYGNLKNPNLVDMNIILWNIDTLDWKYKNKKEVYKRIMKYASDGSIVLAHDLYKTSVDGVLMAMDKLKDEGYAFVTIEEMAEIKQMKLETNKKYYDLK